MTFFLATILINALFFIYQKRLAKQRAEWEARKKLEHAEQETLREREVKVVQNLLKFFAIILINTLFFYQKRLAKQRAEWEARKELERGEQETLREREEKWFRIWSISDNYMIK